MANDAGMAEINELKKKLAASPDSLIFVPLADAYRKAGMLDEAINVCKQGLQKHQSYASARVILGRIYSEKDMFDEAIEEFKKVEAVDNDNIMVHQMLGNIYLKKKRYAEAIEQFQRVLSLNPDDTEIQEKLQDALSAKQEPEEEQAPPAKPEPAKPAPSRPENAKPAADKKPGIDITKSLKAAELYTKKEDFVKAIEIYREILETDTENMLVQQRLREVYDFQNKKEAKAREKSALKAENASKNIDTDKITTEDILDVMKEAVEDDHVDEEPDSKPEVKKPETKKPDSKKVEEKKPEPAKAEEKKQEPAAQEQISKDKTKDLEQILKDLTGTEGMVGAFFLQRDGKIVASVLPKNINAKEIEKSIAQIVDKTEKSVRNMHQGKLNQVVIASESGQLLFTEIKNGVLFMIGNEKINVGKMGFILKDAFAKLKSVLS